MQQRPGTAIPKEPVIFLKATTSLVGPNDELVIPRNAAKVDWEVELAFVIGKPALYVPTDKALDYVAGCVLHNDYSERSFQLERGGPEGWQACRLKHHRSGLLSFAAHVGNQNWPQPITNPISQ